MQDPSSPFRNINRVFCCAASQFGILVKYQVLFAALILLWVYFLIGFDIVHRTLAGAIGAFTALGVLAIVRTKLTLREVATWVDYRTLPGICLLLSVSLWLRFQIVKNDSLRALFSFSVSFSFSAVYVHV